MPSNIIHSNTIIVMQIEGPSLRSMSLVFFAFAGGYTVSNFNKRFLELLSTPVAQFIIFFLLSFFTYYNTPTSLLNIVFMALVCTLILQILRVVVDFIFTQLL